MKSSAGTEELQASFRLIGRGLVRAESLYCCFGNLGKFCSEPQLPPTPHDFLKEELLGIKTGDLELYFEDITELAGSPENLPEYLGVPMPTTDLPLSAKLLRLFWSTERRRRMFAAAIEKEIRRRHGESDDGGTPIPAGYPLRVSYRS